MEITVGILVISDRVFQGKSTDESGPALIQYLHDHTSLFKINNQQPIWKIEKKIVPDEVVDISKQLIAWSDEEKLHLILTTGGKIEIRTNFHSVSDNKTQTLQISRSEINAHCVFCFGMQ